MKSPCLFILSYLVISKRSSSDAMASSIMLQRSAEGNIRI